jgi:LemA protein
MINMKLWIVFGVVVAVVVGILLLLLGISIGVKNGLIAKDEGVDADWAQIETQLQRRGDLIPNLVETVKGYAKHESKVFKDIANARSMLLAAKGPAKKAEADAVLTGALGRLLAVVEQYPNLKADNSFIRLQDELAGTENRIAVARKRYNDSVKIFNMSIKQFPGSLFAPSMGFEEKEYYRPPNINELQKAPEVKFND